MKKVYLHGSLGKKFGREWELDIHSPAEAFCAINANTDGFLSYLSQRAGDDVHYLVTTKNPKDIKTRSEFQKRIVVGSGFDLQTPADEIHITPTPSGGMGVLLAAFTAWWTATGFIQKAFVLIAASMAIQGIMNAIFKPPKREDATTSKSYLFQGVQNKQAQGIPIPLGYGRLIVGSAVVGSSKKSFDLKNSVDGVMESFTQVRLLELLCEGPIQGFCNANGGDTWDMNEAVHFNDTPIKNTAIGASSKPGKDGLDNFGSYNFILNEENIPPTAKLGVDGENIKIEETEVTFDIASKMIGASPYSNDTTQSTGAGALSDLYTNSSNTLALSNSQLNLGGRKQKLKRDVLAGKAGSVALPSAPWKSDEIRDTAGSPPHYSTMDGAIYYGAKLYSHSVSSENAKTIRVAFQSRTSIQKDDGGTAAGAVKFAIRLNFGNQSYFVGSKDGGAFGGRWSSSSLTIDSSNAEEPCFLLQGIATAPYEFDIEFDIPDNLYDYVAYVDGSPTLLADWNLYVENGYVGTKTLGFGRDGLTKGQWGKLHWDIVGSKEDVYIANPPKHIATLGRRPVIQIVKLSTELDPTVKGGAADVGGSNQLRELTLASVTEVLTDAFTYPHSAMAQITFDSKNFSNLPKRGYHAKLKKVLVPSNYSPVTRKYNGSWDGLFKGQDSLGGNINTVSDDDKMWTDNPAWIFYDLLTNSRFGLGKFGVTSDQVDKWGLYKIARYCDELLETGYPDDQIGNNNDGKGQQRRFFTTTNKLSRNEFGVSSSELDVGVFDIEINMNSGDTDDEKKKSFVSEFGDGTSFRGVRVAFFMADGTVEERSVVSSEAGARRITVRGPTFIDHPTTTAEGTSSSQNNTKTGAISQIHHALVEPRFSANIYITEKMEALDILNNMASVFRSIVAYSDGKVSAVQDSSKEIVHMFNSSNVQSEGFQYSGAVKNKRFSAVLVRFNDKNEMFKPSVVFDDDSDAMEKFGYIENDVIAWGCTSKSQALRLAKWILHTSQQETETISFRAGQDSSFLFPGAIFEVSDEMRAGRDKSGRVLGTYSSEENAFEPYVLLDKILKDAPLGKVELVLAAGLASENSSLLDLYAPFDKNEDDQLARIGGVRASQVIKFDGVVESNFAHQSITLQNQHSTVTRLRVKYQININAEKNRFTQYGHPFKNDDQVRFISEGSLPSPLSEFKKYYIVSAGEHTFEVSYIQGGAPVNISDEGLNEYSNAGGQHYISPEDAAVTRSELNNVMIGAPWILKGLFAVQSPERMPEAGVLNLGVTDTSSIYNTSKWFHSSWLGPIYIPDNGGWVLCPALGWVFAKDIADDTGVGNLWFFIAGVGWIWTNDSLKNSFWYCYGLDHSNGGTLGVSGWIFVSQVYDADGVFAGPKYAFIYDSNHASYSKGGTYIFGHGTAADTKTHGSIAAGQSANSPRGLSKKITGVDGGKGGVWISMTADVEADNYTDTAPSVTAVAKPGDTAEGYNSSIADLDISNVQFGVSVKQGGSAVKIVCGSLTRLSSADVVVIRGFNSGNSTLNGLINAKWDVCRVSDLSFELINSGSIALNSTYISELADSSSWSIASTFTTKFGLFVKAVAPTVESERTIKSQLFRCTSVSEAKDNIYEINGIEYNDSKFEAIDKGSIIKKPVLPIPPQEDMSIPTSPTSIILTNLSPK